MSLLYTFTNIYQLTKKIVIFQCCKIILHFLWSFILPWLILAHSTVRVFSAHLLSKLVEHRQ